MGSFDDLDDQVEQVYASMNAHRAQAALRLGEETSSSEEEDDDAPLHVFNAPVFSKHWEGLGTNLAPSAKSKLRQHLKTTQEAAESAASTPRLPTDIDSVPSTARSTASAQPESAIASIKAAHAARSAQLSPRSQVVQSPRGSGAAAVPAAAAPEPAALASAEAASSSIQLSKETEVEAEAEAAEVDKKKSAPAQAAEAEKGRKEERKEGPSESRTRGATGKNDQFGKQEYWDGRFEEEEQYDWLLTFDQVAAQLLPLLKPYGKAARILMVGCGNSTFSADLYDAGYRNIVNLDYSGVVIARMHAQHSAARPGMTWQEGDMTKLATSFPLGTLFDVVIDKAALDALMVDEKSVWSPADSVVMGADATCLGVRDLLRGKSAEEEAVVAPAPVPAAAAASEKPPSMEALVAAALAAEAAQVAAAAHVKLPGLYVMISFMQPHFRTKYLSGKHADGLENSREELHSATGAAAAAKGYVPRYDWHLRHENIDLAGGSFNHFLYIMYRGREDPMHGPSRVQEWVC